jgi:hypothetical protein
MADMRERLIITANVANSRELASDDRLIRDIFLRAPLAGRSRFTLTPDRIVIRQEERVVAEHPRYYGRGETIYDYGTTCRSWAPSEFDWTSAAKDALRWVPPDGLGQSLVSVTLASREVSVMVGLRLFLPESRTDDPERMARAGVPKDRQTALTKTEIADGLRRRGRDWHLAPFAVT